MREIKYSGIKRRLNSNKNKNINTNLLLGNGFSISYDNTIFSYESLSQEIQASCSLAGNLLSKLDSPNIEIIMRLLVDFEKISPLLSSDNQLPNNIKNAINELRIAFIRALQKLHPEHLYEIDETERESCMQFLRYFTDDTGKIFTTNYDLLLYWTLISCNREARDGFGKNPKDMNQLIWGINSKIQNIFYLHGALHLFDEGIDIVKVKGKGNNNYLLENIIQEIDNGKYPIFVSAGTCEEKLKQILHNQYLTDCYNQLKNIKGELFTYGFNFGEYDNHIIDAINSASSNELKSIYIGYFSNEDKIHLKSIRHKFHCDVIFLYDVNLWDTL